MITLTISRTSLGLLPLTIANSGRTAGTYVLTAGGWNPGAVERENSYARSRWLPGAQLVSTRDELMALSLTVRLWSDSVPNLRTMADTLGEALGQFSYTITENVTGALTPRIYDCMPASYSIDSDPVQWRQFTTTLTASIPRQP